MIVWDQNNPKQSELDLTTNLFAWDLVFSAEKECYKEEIDKGMQHEEKIKLCKDGKKIQSGQQGSGTSSTYKHKDHG